MLTGRIADVTGAKITSLLERIAPAACWNFLKKGIN